MKKEIGQKLTPAQQTEVVARFKKGDMYTDISKSMGLPYTIVNKFMTKWKRDNGLLTAASKKATKKSSKKATKKKSTTKRSKKVSAKVNKEIQATPVPVATQVMNTVPSNATQSNTNHVTPSVKPHTVNVSELEFLRKFYFNTIKANISSATIH